MKSKPAGLICAGSVTQSFLARLPSALAAVGPVWSSSLRVARRLANLLRAGFGTSDLSDLNDCGLIWVVLPERKLDDALAQIDFGNTPMIICDTGRPSNRITASNVATVEAADRVEQTFVAEGDHRALRALGEVMAHERRTVIRIQPAAKPLYRAGVRLASDLILPSFAAGIEALRKAGLTRKEASQIAGMLAAQKMRAYLKGGPVALRGLDPELEAIYRRAVAQALEFFGPETR